MKFRVVENKVFPICDICNTKIKDKSFLESLGKQYEIKVICENCAYEIHSAYEANL